MKRRFYLNWNTDKWSNDQDKQSGYRDSYHLTHNMREHNQTVDFMGDYRLSVDNSVIGLEPLQDTTAYGSYNFGPSSNMRPNTNYQSAIKNYRQPLNSNNEPLEMNFHSLGMNTKPIYSSTSLQTNTGLSWKTIGIMALIKLSLLKLKAITVLNKVFFILFKLKLFLIAAVFKFHLLLKLLIFFNILVFPLYLIPIISMLSRFLPRISMTFSKIFNRNNNIASSNQTAVSIFKYYQTINPNDL